MASEPIPVIESGYVLQNVRCVITGDFPRKLPGIDVMEALRQIPKGLTGSILVLPAEEEVLDRSSSRYDKKRSKTRRRLECKLAV